VELTTCSTDKSMLPTKLRLASAITSTPREKRPLAMKSFMIWIVSGSRTLMPPTSSKATVSQKPTRPTLRRALL
jgi:hypothetical protein